MIDTRTRHQAKADGATVPPRPPNPGPDRPIDTPLPPATAPSKTPNPMTVDLPKGSPQNEDLEQDEPEVPAPKHASGTPRRETAQAPAPQPPLRRALGRPVAAPPRDQESARHTMHTSDRGQTNRDLIAADKVQGTTVYNHAGEMLGSIESVMIDKRTGKVAYATLSFGGGFLGLFDHSHPLPWSVMSYDRSKGGYVVGLDKKTLENARRYKTGERIDWETPEYGRRVDEYDQVPSYWM